MSKKPATLEEMNIKRSQIVSYQIKCHLIVLLNGLRIVSFMLNSKTIQMIGFITFLSTISISVVAAFYSIVGLYGNIHRSPH